MPGWSFIVMAAIDCNVCSTMSIPFSMWIVATMNNCRMISLQSDDVCVCVHVHVHVCACGSVCECATLDYIHDLKYSRLAMIGYIYIV